MQTRNDIASTMPGRWNHHHPIIGRAADDPRYNQYLLSLHRAETITNLSHRLFSVVTVQIAARDRRTRMGIPGRRRHA